MLIAVTMLIHITILKKSITIIEEGIAWKVNKNYSDHTGFEL